MADISIIIPAYNEEDYIGKTLESIQNQNFEDNYETIIVDDRSKDKTAKIARSFGATVIKQKDNRGIVSARNEGASHAKNNYLLFLEADTLLVSTNILQKISDKFDSGFVVGTCLGKPQVNNIKNNLLQFIKNIGTRLDASNEIIFCRKDQFEKIGGFKKEAFPRENANFIRRLKRYGKRIVLKERVLTSQRRYEKIGYLKLSFFWIEDWFGLNNAKKRLRVGYSN